MESVLNDLSSIPGLTGAFVYDAKGRILGNTLPAVFKPAKIQSLGKILSKIHTAGCMNFADLSETVLSFDESTILVRSILEKSWVVLIGEPALNVNMAALSLNLVVDDLKEFVDSCISNAGNDLTTLPPPPPQQAPVLKLGVSLAELMESTVLGPTLQGMNAALGKVVGPMARIIFMECLETWAKGSEPSKENLPKLLTLLTREIKDEENASRYRKLVDSLL